MSSSVRTRFAPSPTGYIHLGNVRAALYPWLLAKQTGGTFILRIEDTDRARYVPEATKLIIDTLQWLGIEWDEGPDKGGDYGPYIQSERKDHYLTWAQKLIDKGLAYADPYSPEEVQAFRDKAQAEKRPFLYRNHRPESPPVWDKAVPLRFRVPEVKRYTWNDAVMGELTAGPEALDDFVLIKSDGMPTYNFAHIIDDVEMGVTHVMRGVEYVSSTPNYLALYEALEIDQPVLVSMPHIMAPNGKKKLGKRDGAKSAEEYRNDGFLPEAMINFLAGLGWNDGTEQEIFSREELIEKFSLDRVQRSGARFDEQRLIWMNGQWIRRLALDDLYGRVEDFWPEEAAVAEEAYKKQVLGLVQDRLRTLADLPMMTSYFFKDPQPDWASLKESKQLKNLTEAEIKDLLARTHTALEGVEFDSQSLQAALNLLLESTGQKPAVLFSLIRLVVSWAPFSPALPDTLAVLGKSSVLRRVQTALSTVPPL